MGNSKVIARKFLVELYKRDEEARSRNHLTSFNLNEIITASFYSNERETIIKYFQRFPEFFRVRWHSSGEGAHD